MMAQQLGGSREGERVDGRYPQQQQEQQQQQQQQQQQPP